VTIARVPISFVISNNHSPRRDGRSYKAQCSRSQPVQRPSRLFRCLRIIATGLLLVGCSAVITSTPVSNCSGDQCKIPTGIAYSLPKGQVQLTASRHAVQPADVAQAQANYLQAAATVAKDQNTVAANQKTKLDDVNRGASPLTIAADDAQIAAALAQLAVDQALADGAKRTLAQLQNAQGMFIETASLSALSPAPDPTRRYVADLHHYPTRDDNVKFNVANGLLNTASIVTTDQTPAIIQTIADTAIAIAALVGGIPVPGSLTMMTNPLKGSFTEAQCSSYDLQTIFDPLDKHEVQAVHNALDTAHSNIKLTLDPDPRTPPTVGSGVQLKDLKPQHHIAGFIYRIATRVLVSISARPSACDMDLPKGQSIAAIVPDSRFDFIVKANAGVFTTTTTSWAFSNGILTDYNTQRPSELLAAVNLPLNIIQDVFNIPTSLLKLRVNYDTQATAAVNGEAALRQAQINQLTTIITAQTQLMQAQINQPATVAQAQTAYLTALQALAKAIAAQSSTPAPK
jgi:hypothetical protein